MKNGQPDQPDDMLTTAMAVRTADAIDKHLNTVQQVTRLALDESRDSVQTMRDEVIESLRQANELNAKLIEQMAMLIDFFKDHVASPPVVNVPQANVTMTQQPVTVNVPTAAVQVAPKITVPEAQIVIDRPEPKLPTTATISHSDGTQSTISFGKR